MGLDYARVLTRNGYVTISPEHFCCATRLPKEGPYDTAAFYKKHPDWSAIGKSTFENHIALNVLAAMPEVDPSRLGATGLSLGGHNTVFIAAYDSRVKCAVPIVGGTTINENPDQIQWSRDYWYIYIPQIRAQILKGERIQCDFHEMMALAAPCPLLEYFSLNDGDPRTQAHRTALHVKVHEVYRLLEREGAHAFVVGGDGHSMPDLTRVGMVSWMDRWLKHDGNPNATWDARPALE
jgi:dienelactone hydrolase